MVFSLLVAFVVTPWAAVRLLRLATGTADTAEARPRGPCHPAYRWLMSRLVGRPTWRWTFLGLIAPAPPRSGRLRSGRVGPGEDAALRQQERAGDRPQHARGQLAGADRAGGPGDRRRHPPGEGGHRLSGLRRDGGTLQLQRADAALLPAARARAWRRCRSTSCPSTSVRRRATRSPSASDPPSPRSPLATARGRGGRGAAGPAGAAVPGRRGVRTGRRGRASAWPEACEPSSPSTPGVVDVDWYVEVSAPQGAPASSTRRRPRSTASRPTPSPGPSASRWAASRSGCCTSRASRRTSTSCSTCRGRQRTRDRRSAGAPSFPDGRGQAHGPAGRAGHASRARSRTGASTTRISCRWSTSPATSPVPPRAPPTRSSR